MSPHSTCGLDFQPPSTLRQRALKVEAAQSLFFEVNWVPLSLLHLGAHHSIASFLAPRDPMIRVRAVAPGTRLIVCRSKRLNLRAVDNSIRLFFVTGTTPCCHQRFRQWSNLITRCGMSPSFSVLITHYQIFPWEPNVPQVCNRCSIGKIRTSQYSENVETSGEQANQKCPNCPWQEEHGKSKKLPLLAQKIAGALVLSVCFYDSVLSVSLSQHFTILCLV